MSNDRLGQRMKEQYEHRTRCFLPRRTYTIIRLDGKAFHTFTKSFDRPFDLDFEKLMNETAAYLCSKIQNAKCAYVQSDEISILMSDFDTVATDAWFNGNIQKIVSVSASTATYKFNMTMNRLLIEGISDDGKESKLHNKLTNKGRLKVALFDSRVFTIPDPIEVENYFIWRQQDATRNSIQMLAQSLYSHKQLHGKNTSEQQEMTFKKGHNWNNLPVGQKRGRMIIRKEDNAGRMGWAIDEPPIFTQEREYLQEFIAVIDRSTK